MHITQFTERKIIKIMRKRIGNDFLFYWIIKENNVIINPDDVLDFKIIIRHRRTGSEIVAEFDVVNSSPRIKCENLLYLGIYDLIATWKTVDYSFEDDFRNSSADVQGFEIVTHSSLECETDLTVTSEIAIGFEGADAFEVWVKNGNEGKTYEDYIAFLQKPATLAAAAADLAKEVANSSATLANDKAVLAQSAATLANTKAGLANDAAVLATDKATLADSKATLANEKAALAQSAADNANAKAAEVTSAVLSAGQLGSIKPTDAAPTPARNGNYTFSIGGNKPAWLTAEAGVTTVKAGDGVAVVYTAPSSYSYTHVDTGSSIDQARSQSTSKVPSSKLVDDELKKIEALKDSFILSFGAISTTVDSIIITGSYNFVYIFKNNGEVSRQQILAGTYVLTGNNKALVIDTSLTGTLTPYVHSGEINDITSKSVIPIATTSPTGVIGIVDSSSAYRSLLNVIDSKERQFILTGNVSIVTRQITFSGGGGYTFVYKSKHSGTTERLRITQGSYTLEISGQNNFGNALVIDKTLGDVEQIPTVVNIFSVTKNQIIIAATGGSGLIEYVLSHDVRITGIENSITNINLSIQNLQTDISSINSNIKLGGTLITDEVLYKNQEKYLGSDGKLIATSGTWWKVSDFIEIKDGVTIKAFNRKDSYTHLAYAFYTDADENTFISGYHAPDASSYNAVMNMYEGTPHIPSNAKYIRTSGNISYASNYVYLLLLLKSFIEKERPLSQLHYFNSAVNILSQDTDSTTDAVQFPYSASIDYCALLLPKNYDPYKKPYPLVIYSHGAGSPVIASSCNINGGFAMYLANKGFAVLDCNALPNSLKKSWMHETQCAGFGSEFSINSVINAYEYCINNYNIAKDKVFALSTSMGGLTTGNLISTGKLPFRAVWMDCPVTGLYESAWVHPWWSDSRMIHMAIAYLYNFDNWDETEQTFTVLSGAYAGTYSFTTSPYEATQILRLKAFYDENIAKTVGLNPWGNKRIKEGATDIIIYPCPLVISQGSTDTVNDINVNRNYLNLVKAGGQVASFREFPTSTHGLFNVGTQVEDEEGILAYPIPIEICRFFKKYL